MVFSHVIAWVKWYTNASNFSVFGPLQVGYQIRLKQSRLNSLKTKTNLIYMSRSFRTVQWTNRLGYKNKSVSVVYENNRFMIWDKHKTLK